MAVSQSQIDALNDAIAQGERTVKSDGVEVEYRSVGELIRARDALLAQLARETTPTRARQTVLVHGGRGFRG